MTVGSEAGRRHAARRHAARRDAAQREAARRDAARVDAARRDAARVDAELGRREAGRIRVGSSGLREGRPDRMDTTTQRRDPRRSAGAPPPHRGGNGPFRADPRAGDPQLPDQVVRGGGRPDSGRPDSGRPASGGADSEGATSQRADSRRSKLTRADARRENSRRGARPPLHPVPDSQDHAAAARPGRPAQAPAPGRPSPGRPSPRRAAPGAAPGRSADAQATSQAARRGRLREAGRSGLAAGAASLPRMPFVLLVLALLGGGLICLLVINTTLGATSFRISQLQSTSTTLATQEQTLQQQIAAEESPAQIARRAYQLGMRTQGDGNILDLRTHRVYKLPGQPGAATPLGTVITSHRAARTRTAAHRARLHAGQAPAGNKAKPSRRGGSRR
jgi:hypothetical protein